MGPNRAAQLFSGIYLGLIWLISSLPLAVVWIEFRHVPFCESSFALFLTTYYGSYFLFFAVFGWLAAIALFFPFATAVTILLEHRSVLYTAIAMYAVMTAVVALVEFFGSPGAMFELSPRVLAAPSGQQFLADFAKICDPSKKFEGGYAVFQTKLQYLIQLGRSYSSAVYYFAFVAQALFLIAIFAVFIVAIRYRDRMRTLAPRFLRNAIFFLLGYAIFAVSMWCLLRISYRMDSDAIFGTNNPLYADYLIIALYAVVLAVYILYFEFAFEKLAKIMTSIGGFLTFVFGVTLVQKGMASQIIGIRASVFNLVAVILLFLLISLILLAFMLRPAPEDPDS